MRTVATIFVAIVVTAASSSAFVQSSNVYRPLPSSSSLQYRQDESFAELDKLKAKRLLIRQDRQNNHQPKIVSRMEDHNLQVEDDGSMIIGQELEYLYDETEEERGYSENDLYHIILMPSTFHNNKNNKEEMMTIENVAETCTEILGIDANKAYDISLFVKHEGFSCLGTWTHTECLSLGKELVERDLDCRIVPFNGGSSDESYAFAIAEAGATTVMVNDNDESYYYYSMTSMTNNDHNSSSMDIASIAAYAELTNRIHSQTALKTLYCGTDTAALL
jgi:hypothetical protein